ncbi:MAG: hypothetical protein HC817_13230 [Saprospiraceae bacterium]|nr:hypothetical protein [Saprospiraceae bacterium]
MRNPQHMMGWGWIQSPLEERDAKNKKKMLWQCGESGGFAGFMGFVKENQTAVIVLSNSSSSVDDIGQNVLINLEKMAKKMDSTFPVPKER